MMNMKLIAVVTPPSIYHTPKHMIAFDLLIEYLTNVLLDILIHGYFVTMWQF